jgi:hypothetical protein
MFAFLELNAEASVVRIDRPVRGSPLILDPRLLSVNYKLGEAAPRQERKTPWALISNPIEYVAGCCGWLLDNL